MQIDNHTGFHSLRFGSAKAEEAKSNNAEATSTYGLEYLSDQFIQNNNLDTPEMIELLKRHEKEGAHFTEKKAENKPARSLLQIFRGN